MMPTLVFATGNPNKLAEVRDLLQDNYRILGLADIGCEEDIPETSPTLQGNALIKVRYLREKYGRDGFAEDTGLEVYALDMKPGVHTARYAGPEKDAKANMNKLIKALDGQNDRRARFRTVVALSMDGKEYLFEGIVEGAIAEKASGDGGFGYDPVFIPKGYQQTFGELPADVKQQISHRARAISSLTQFLEES